MIVTLVVSLSAYVEVSHGTVTVSTTRYFTVYSFVTGEHFLAAEHEVVV